MIMNQIKSAYGMLGNQGWRISYYIQRKLVYFPENPARFFWRIKIIYYKINMVMLEMNFKKRILFR